MAATTLFQVAILALCLTTSAAFRIPSMTTIKSRSLQMNLTPVSGGSVVALVTPMKEDKTIDYPKFVELLEWHMAEGTDGAVILGTTGEGSLVSMEERTRVIKTAVDTVKKSSRSNNFPIIVGTGCIQTEEVIKLTQNAYECGADASLIITPYYVKPPQRALVKHFRDIADAVPLPMVLYNCPGRTGVDMKPETIAECATHERIVAVKDATGDLARVQQIRDSCGKDFLIFSGEDDSGCEFVRIGGDGVISVTANVVPKMMHEMLSLSKQGRKAEAEAIDAKLALLHKRLFLESNPICVKASLHLMKSMDYGIRPPLDKMASKFDAELKEALRLTGNNWKL